MQRRLLFLSVTAVALATNLLAVAVHAQPAPAAAAKLTPAQALYEEATKAMDAKDYATACPKLEEVVRLVPERVGGRFTLALCYESAGKLASAYTSFKLAETMTPDERRPGLQRQAHDKAEALRPKLARLAIVVAGGVRALPGLEIQRDGVPVGAAQWGVPIPVDKGEHRVVAIATGKRAWEKAIVVSADGSSETVAVDALPDALPAAPPAVVPPPEPPPRVAPPPPAVQPPPARSFWQRHRASASTGGAAVVLAGVGVGLGIGTWSRYGQLSSTCEGACSSGAVDAVKREAVATNVLFGVAGAAAVTAVGIFVFGERASVTVAPAQGGANVVVHY